MYEYIHMIVHIHTCVLYMCGKFPGYLHIQQKFNLPVCNIGHGIVYQHFQYKCARQQLTFTQALLYTYCSQLVASSAVAKHNNCTFWVKTMHLIWYKSKK